MTYWGLYDLIVVRLGTERINSSTLKIKIRSPTWDLEASNKTAERGI